MNSAATWTPQLVRELHEASGLDTPELARALGVHRWTLWAWKAGRTAPEREHVAVLDFLASKYLHECPTCHRPYAR